MFILIDPAIKKYVTSELRMSKDPKKAMGFATRAEANAWKEENFPDVSLVVGFRQPAK